jgi:transcriptional regulator with XRE-family HTH domain
VPTALPAHSTAPQRRHELGAFLRSRRERLICADVGIPATGRRRTPGLRREEVAMLAGISTTWLTYLEQGRHVQASRQVLQALATTLQLSAAERTHVFDLASEAPPAAAVAVLAPTVCSITKALDPHPAYVTAGDFEVLAWNAAALRLFPGFVGRDGARPNVARWLFCDPDARGVFQREQPTSRTRARRREAAEPGG